MIENTAKQTQEQAMALANALGTKIDFYEYQNLRDQLAQERTKNVVLENRVYSDAKFNALERQNEANDIDIVVPSRTIYNGQCEKLLIQQAIPVSTNGNAVPVKLTIGDASVLLLDRCGNAVFSDQLKSRKIYDIRFHTTALTATILCSIPNCTSGVNTVFNPATPPSEPVPSN